MPDLFDRLRVALADRYAVEHELGSGGMATVYLAEDLKHHRKVAVKVLRPELGAALGPERFLREIEVAAKLNHPHILTLFDSGEAADSLYYVTPYVERESLRQKLNREKQLPIDDAVKIGTQVASALDYAHRHNVIHRDIKPENILLQDGQALVADFGIALAVQAAGGTRLTEAGLSLGTPQYMSPEQATGDRELDGRSDIYSLGCVTYEMLVGDPPHTGSTAQAIMTKVVIDTPRSIAEVRETVPHHVDDTVHKALAKLPADRFATGELFARALAEPVAISVAPRPSQRLSQGRGSHRASLARVIPWALLAAVSTWGVLGWLRSTPPLAPARFVLSFPPATRPLGSHLAFSPDGSRFVFHGPAATGRQLFIRGLDDFDARPIPGTEHAIHPFFSPGGDWLGFYADGELKKVQLSGGSPIALADVPGSGPLGASWGANDVILFTAGGQNGLFRVSGGGGEAEMFTIPDFERGERQHMWPDILPDGKVALLQVAGDTNYIASVSLESGEITRLFPGNRPLYLASGHLLFTPIDGEPAVVRFDARRLAMQGRPARLSGEVPARPAVSRTGNLAYFTGSGSDALVLMGREGNVRTLADDTLGFDSPRFSPSGTQITFARPGGVWAYDLGSGMMSRLTFIREPGYPEWSPDGTRIAFTAGGGLFVKSLRGGLDAEEVLSRKHPVWMGSWSPGGHDLVSFETRTMRDGPSERRIMVLPLDGAAEPWQFSQDSVDEVNPNLSPDGRWLAYTRWEATHPDGRPQVFVRSFPDRRGPWQVSTGLGSEPRWAPDGGQLFYRSGNKLIAAVVDTDPEFRVVSQEVLFERRFFGDTFNTRYDVHPDGHRFVMVVDGERSFELRIVLNWFEEVQQLVSAVQ
jgi:serine/threonine-protein kinase